MLIEDVKTINQCKELSKILIGVNKNLVMADRFEIIFENDSKPYINFISKDKLLGTIPAELLNYTVHELEKYNMEVKSQKKI